MLQVADGGGSASPKGLTMPPSSGVDSLSNFSDFMLRYIRSRTITNHYLRLNLILSNEVGHGGVLYLVIVVFFGGLVSRHAYLCYHCYLCLSFGYHASALGNLWHASTSA